MPNVGKQVGREYALLGVLEVAGAYVGGAAVWAGMGGVLHRGALRLLMMTETPQHQKKHGDLYNFNSENAPIWPLCTLVASVEVNIPH